MSGLSIDEAVALFSTLFSLAIWAVGFIAIAYMLSILRVLGQQVRKIRFGRH